MTVPGPSTAYAHEMPVCPSCGRRFRAPARFCADCGVPLTVEDPADREVRKTVTVVFSDLVGSTALGERLDPSRCARS